MMIREPCLGSILLAASGAVKSPALPPSLGERNADADAIFEVVDQGEVRFPSYATTRTPNGWHLLLGLDGDEFQCSVHHVNLRLKLGRERRARIWRLICGGKASHFSVHAKT